MMRNIQEELLRQITNCLGENDLRVKEIKILIENKKIRNAYVIIRKLRDDNLIDGDNMDELIERYWWDYAN